MLRAPKELLSLTMYRYIKDNDNIFALCNN